MPRLKKELDWNLGFRSVQLLVPKKFLRPLMPCSVPKLGVAAKLKSDAGSDEERFPEVGFVSTAKVCSDVV